MGAKGEIFRVGDNIPCFKRSQASVMSKEKGIVHDVSVGSKD